MAKKELLRTRMLGKLMRIGSVPVPVGIVAIATLDFGSAWLAEVIRSGRQHDDLHRRQTVV